jgi:hypothetical protein
MHYKYGGKTLYYMNTFDGATDDKLIEENELKGNKKEEEEACEACNI